MSNTDEIKISAPANKSKKKTDVLNEIAEYFDNINIAPKVPERPSVGESPTYERLSYDYLTDDEIQKTAKDLLSAYENESKSAINDDIEMQKQKLDTNATQVAKSLNSSLENIANAYKDANEDFNVDMLKRGLARSSIAVNKKAELSKAEADARVLAQNEYNKQIDDINSQISQLETKRNKALNDFNLAYATKLTQTIAELTDKRDEKKQEAIRYNNSLLEKEFNDTVSKNKTESDLYSDALNQELKEYEINTTDDAVTQRNKKAYEEVKKVLSQLSDSEARDIVLNSEIIRGNLSGYYYYKLYNDFVK